MALLEDPYPDIERASPPLAQPLHEPSLVLSRHNKADDISVDVVTRSASATTRSSVVSKRQSYNLSGSTFLVTASGMTLKLPIPSESPSDPLNWSLWKRAGAMFALAWFFVASSLVVQAPSVILPGIALEFSQQVSNTLIHKSDHHQLTQF